MPNNSEPAEPSNNKQQQQPAKKSGGGGFLGGLKSKLTNMIVPDVNPVHLPDDTNPSIQWDPQLQRWVGEGVEQEVAPPPPPVGLPTAAAPAAPVAPGAQPTSATNPMFPAPGAQPSAPTAAAAPARSRLQKGE